MRSLAARHRRLALPLPRPLLFGFSRGDARLRKLLRSPTPTMVGARCLLSEYPCLHPPRPGWALGWQRRCVPPAPGGVTKTAPAQGPRHPGGRGGLGRGRPQPWSPSGPALSCEGEGRAGALLPPAPARLPPTCRGRGWGWGCGCGGPRRGTARG